MANIFNRKKSASKDYTTNMLPRTRKEVFFDVLKLHWKKFLLYGLLFLLFSLPLQLASLAEFVATINLQKSAEIPVEQIPYAISLAKIVVSLIKIPCFLLLAVAVAGFLRVIRQYSWLENVNFSYEFSQGVKGNIGQTLLVAILVGIANVVATFFVTIAETSTDLFSSVLTLVPTAIIILFLLPIFAYALVSISIYKSKFGAHFNVGRVLYSQQFWKTLLAIVCCFVPFVLQVIPNFVCQLVGAIVSPMFAPFVFLGWYLFSLNGLDKFVNVGRYPTLIDKGLNVDKQESSITQQTQDS